MEMVMLSISVLSAVFAIFIFVEKGLEDNYYLLVVPIMAFVLFALRRSVRLRREKEERSGN
jgi:hypothetical protein